MDILRRCLSFDLSRDGCPPGDHSRDGAALLAAFGESDFSAMWRKLFHTLRIAPVIVSLGKQGEEATGTSFSFAPSPFWGGHPVSDEAAGFPPAGKAFTVVAATVSEAPAVASDDGPVNSNTKGAAPARSVPACLQSTYHFRCSVPDFDAQEGPITIGYVLLLAFPYTAMHDKDSDDDVILRAIAPSAERGLLAWHRPLSAALGTCYYRTRVAQALKCTSMSRPASNFRVLVNINVVNVAKHPVCVKWVSFDIFSTWVGDTLGNLSSVPLWAEQRSGPRGVDLRTVSFMRDAVTITPIMVNESRVPLTLQPAESVGFLYAIQVQPHLRYLLQSHSLRDVYGPFVKNVSSLDLDTKLGRYPLQGTTKPKATSTTIKTGEVKTSAGESAAGTAAVPREALTQVLSSNFTSHVYVHYEVLSPGTTNHTVPRKEGEQLGGLQLRHAVHWSLMP